MKPPTGSTSSLMMVAVSDDLTVAQASGVNRSTMVEEIEPQARRSMRSPSTPLATLIQYLNAPLMMTKNRNRPERPSSNPMRPTSKPWKIWIDAPPSHSGSLTLGGATAPGLPVPESFALDSLVDDLARKIERREIKRLRRQHRPRRRASGRASNGSRYNETGSFPLAGRYHQQLRGAIGFQRPLPAFQRRLTYFG